MSRTQGGPALRAGTALRAGRRAAVVLVALSVLASACSSGSGHEVAPTSAPPTSGGATTTLTAPPSTSAPSTSPPGAPPVYGLTVDDPSVVPTDTLVKALEALPERPTVRIYFDVQEPASSYLDLARALAPHASLMGEILDSSDEKALSAAGAESRARDYTSILGPYISIWEVGNEVNGSWLGNPADVEAKLAAVYSVVAASGGRTALTLYANHFGPNNCGDGTGEATPVDFSRQRVPGAIRDRLDYVLLSYYPDQCGGVLPTDAQVRDELEALHALYPAAGLGFGEVGLPDPVKKSTTADARRIMHWAYSLDPRLSYYRGGYFWWYAVEDALAPGSILAADLPEAFGAERLALDPVG